MEEQSHKDEMRAALRGDFERMRRRLSSPGSETAEPPSAETSKDRPASVDALEASTGSWLERLLGRA